MYPNILYRLHLLYVGVCPFGKAHVDSPLGDLDSSGTVSNDIVYNQMYPLGVYESFPVLYGPNNTRLSNTAHAYRECSNKGTCDRNTGLCICMSGFEGSSCQRNACPGQTPCNGNGACVSAREMAWLDYNNIYQLWDADSLYGCKCDPGYHGSDCFLRKCKQGYDPMYFDQENSRMYETSRRYSNWTIIIAASINTTIIGNFSLIFYDYNTQPWYTNAIPYNATCVQLTDILEAIPNDVIKKNTTLCYKIPYFVSSEVSLNNLGFALSNNTLIGMYIYNRIVILYYTTRTFVAARCLVYRIIMHMK